MLVKKITTGYVLQVYDTKLEKFVSQEFVASDIVDHEDMMGNPVDELGLDLDSDYLPFDMVQPQDGLGASC